MQIGSYNIRQGEEFQRSHSNCPITRNETKKTSRIHPKGLFCSFTSHNLLSVFFQVEQVVHDIQRFPDIDVLGNGSDK